MDRRKFLKNSLALTAGISLAGHSFASPFISTGARKPNIIIILCDDLGYGDIGCYGNEIIRTKAIDQLANEGVRFTDFYASAPVCSPSRAGLITGRYPPRTLITEVLFPSTGIESIVNLEIAISGSAVALPKDELTLAQILKDNGYTTSCIGKWHLGDIPGFLPNDRGFHHYFGLLYSNDMSPLKLYRNKKVVEKAPVNQDFLTQKYTEEALWFIKENRDKPFFIYFCHTFPHEPLHASPDFRGKSKAGIYGDCIEEIDFSIAKIMDALSSYGIRENTFIMFASDNGPWWNGNPGYHRGRKNETFEGGMAVPFIASWPGEIPEGIVISEPAMNIDLFTTSLAVAKINPPEDRIIDGKNLLPLLSGKEKTTPHQFIYYYRGKNLEAVRMGQWKYQLKHFVPYLPLGLPKGPWLFDLKSDPNESYNLYNEEPELVKQFEKAIENWEKNFNRGIKI